MSENEKPKTMWELLHQETWWVSKDKRWVKLEDIDLSYARNLWAFLCRHATRYGAQVAAWLDYTVLTTPIDPFIGEMAEDALNRAAEAMWEEAFLARRKTDIWFSQLEFVKALKKKLAELEAEAKLQEQQEAMVRAGGV